MKRIIALALIGAVVAGSAFAEITFGAGGTARWSPLVIGGAIEDGDEVTYAGVGSGPNWGHEGAAVAFTVNGKNESETVGFQLQLRGESDNTFHLPDPRAYIWSKPFGDILKVTMGLYDDDTLRGKFGDITHGTSAYGVFVSGEDAIFQRLRSNNPMGALIALYPVDGLSIFANVGVSDKATETPTKYALTDVFGSGQYAIGYNISGIGLARFQFIGGTFGKSSDSVGLVTYTAVGKAWNQIQLAFNLTAVDKLNLDFGATIPLAVEYTKRDDVPFDFTGFGKTLGDGDKYSAPIHIALAAKYDLSPIVIQTRIDVDLGESFAPKTGDKSEGGTDITFALLPTYNVSGVGTLGARISLKLTGNDKVGGTEQKSDTTDLGLGFYYDRNIFAGCNFAVGIAAAIPVSGAGYDGDAHKEAKAAAFHLAIPIVLSYSL
jgi:hypothetical protein